MTSRERVLTALAHKEPDKVPIDLGATYNSGISACALYRLREYYGLEKRPIQIYETSQMIGTMEPDIMERMHIDVIGLNSANDCAGVPLHGPMQDFTMPDGTPVKISAAHKYKVDEKGRSFLYPQGNDSYDPSYVMPEGGYFFDAIPRSPGYDEDNLTPEEDFKEDLSPFPRKTPGGTRKTRNCSGRLRIKPFLDVLAWAASATRLPYQEEACWSLRESAPIRIGVWHSFCIRNISRLFLKCGQTMH